MFRIYRVKCHFFVVALFIKPRYSTTEFRARRGRAFFRLSQRDFLSPSISLSLAAALLITKYPAQGRMGMRIEEGGNNGAFALTAFQVGFDRPHFSSSLFAFFFLSLPRRDSYPTLFLSFFFLLSCSDAPISSSRGFFRSRSSKKESQVSLILPL